MTRSRALRLLAVGVVAAGVVTAVVLRPEPDRIRELLTESGPWGPLVFVVSMWLLQPLGPPGVLWMIPAGVVWPWPVAVGLSWLGNMGASSIGFAFSRWAGREWVAARLPRRLRAIDSRLGERGVGPVVALRLVTGQFPPADWALGVTSVRWRTFLVGTGIGIAPGIVLIVVAGGNAFQWAADRGPAVWVAAGTVVALGAGAVWVVRRRLDRAAPPVRA